MREIFTHQLFPIYPPTTLEWVLRIGPVEVLLKVRVAVLVEVVVGVAGATEEQAFPVVGQQIAIGVGETDGRQADQFGGVEFGPV